MSTPHTPEQSPVNKGSVLRTHELASKLKVALDGAVGKDAVVLDKDLVAAVWSQLLANAELTRNLMVNATSAVNVEGTAFPCSKALSDALQPILHQHMLQAVEAEVARDLAESRSGKKA